MAAAKKKAAAKKAAAVHCVMFLHPKARKDLAKYYEGAAKAIDTYFAPPEKESDVSAKDIALADKVAAALKGVVHSTDTDCEYFACVLSGVDLEDDAAFFRALGVGRKDRAKIGGYDYDKLETLYGPLEGEANTPIVQLLTKLGDDEFEELDEYVEKPAQKSYEKAAKLLADMGVVVGGVLCADDNVSKLVFTVAKTTSKAWVGVLTCRIET